MNKNVNLLVPRVRRTNCGEKFTGRRRMKDEKSL